LKLLFTIFAFIIFLQPAIGQFSPAKSSYHNMTAHYNSFFIARERIKEVESRIHQKYEWNYNAILPIFPPFDTLTSKSLKTELEDCIEKASMAIQRHPESRWEDNAYILVGKARLYGSEFSDAIETFKFVNTNGDHKNERHTSLIQLLRTFTEAGETNNAIAVSDYLKKQEMNRENLTDLYMNRAYFYQKREDYNNMVQNLVKAEELMTNSNDKARIDFIIGQVYQQLGFSSNAYNYYKQALRKSKTYELTFYTRLNMAQVTELTSNMNVKRIDKYFRKLIKDPKNKEFLDRVYFELGDFNLKQGDLLDAIAAYNLSISAKGKSQRQKGMAYHRLGMIYYDSMKNFELAKAYYDSTIQFLPKDEKDYKAIVKRHEVLDEFVQYLTIINKNDSLIALANMNSIELENVVEQYLAQLTGDFEKTNEKQKKSKNTSSSVSSSFYNEPALINLSDGNAGTWYFYNTSAVSQGQFEFKKKWGERTLEDNWRRKNKAVSTDGKATGISESNVAIAKESAADQEAKVFDADGEKNKFLSAIPKSEDQINQLLDEIEFAYYSLGNIYHFKLNESQNAINSFKNLLTRFPGSTYEPEVLYQLFLLTKLSDTTTAQFVRNQLIDTYPESLFTKLIDNPNYREESKAMNDLYRKIYEESYAIYKAGEYSKTLTLIDSALYESDANDFTDNLMLLRAMTLGRIDGLYKYQFELNNFIQNFQESDLVPYAKKLVKASEDYQINLYTSSKAKYIQNFSTPHYFLLLYPTKQTISEIANSSVKDYIKAKKYVLSTGNIILNENFALVLVNELPSKGTAETFYSEFVKSFNFEPFLGEKIYTLLITVENFEIFYESKDLQTYLTFFDQHYKQ